MYKSKFGKAASITPDQFVSCPFTQEKRRIENLYMYVGCYIVCDFQLWKILYYKLYVVAHKQQLPFRFKQWLQWDGIIPSYMVMRRYNWNIETFPRNLLINRNEIKYSFYIRILLIWLKFEAQYWDIEILKKIASIQCFERVFFFFLNVIKCNVIYKYYSMSLYTFYNASHSNVFQYGT